MFRPGRGRTGPDPLLRPSIVLFFLAALLMGIAVRTDDGRFALAAAGVATAVLLTRLVVRARHARANPPPEGDDEVD